MINTIVRHKLTLGEKLDLMRHDARFDVADNDAPWDLAAIREGIKAPPPPAKAPKIFLSNECAFNCAYCGCRATNDTKRGYTIPPKELAELAVNSANATGQGIFITSAVCRNADYTGELVLETIKTIRQNLWYRGYIHAKIMPGADEELIRRTGLYADRLSINIEVAKSEGYKHIARNKNKDNILKPMGQISRLIAEKGNFKRFATSAVTQIMAGSTGESDREIVNLSSSLYRKFGLSRIYFTPFQYQNPARGYADLSPAQIPTWRAKRLYQADWLLRLYGFTSEEITPEAEPNLVDDLDPKAAWALRNIHLYPIEINTAEKDLLLRIPGIGITYAARIIKARKYCTITHDVLKNLGVSLYRSRHFLTCDGKYEGAKCENLVDYRKLLRRPLSTFDTDADVLHSVSCCV